VSFDVDPEAYARFMGRFAAPLAAELVDLLDLPAGSRVLDVGCGPGPLTDALVTRLGVDRVSAVDPSRPFVAMLRERYPSMDVRLGTAEGLDHPDGAFDATLASLVVPFMSDAAAGLARMAAVTRPGGVVAVTAWDHAGGHGPLQRFWVAARELDADVQDESDQVGVADGELAPLLAGAGIDDVRSTALEVEVRHLDFDDWWQPYTLGVGPAGSYVSRLDGGERARLEKLLRGRAPRGPFTTQARAWTAWGQRA
jgi:SAM-dependent methyltransferase